jgi:hypothetical protein
MHASFSFGIAGFVLVVATFLSFPYGLIVSFPIAGLVASLLICRGNKPIAPRVAAAAWTAASFGVTGWTVAFSLISLQADVEPVWGAFAWGLGFGLAGAISGRSLSRLWRRGGQGSVVIPFAGSIAGLAFAMSGGVSGFLGFWGFPVWNVPILIACIWLAFQLGGLGVDLGWHLALKHATAGPP